jgi:hypothetical protein
MPPPLPRSSTTSPSRSSARAVGLPHPRDASTAVSGREDAVTESYRSRVMGSLPSGPHPHDVPQHPPLDPEAARTAASPYFRRTPAFTSPLIVAPRINVC